MHLLSLKRSGVWPKRGLISLMIHTLFLTSSDPLYTTVSTRVVCLIEGNKSSWHFVCNSRCIVTWLAKSEHVLYWKRNWGSCLLYNPATLAYFCCLFISLSATQRSSTFIDTLPDGTPIVSVMSTQSSIFLNPRCMHVACDSVVSYSNGIHVASSKTNSLNKCNITCLSASHSVLSAVVVS